MKKNFFKIKNRFVGDKKKVFIIAEIGINHDGSFKKCLKMFTRCLTDISNMLKDVNAWNSRYSRHSRYQNSRYSRYSRCSRYQQQKRLL